MEKLPNFSDLTHISSVTAPITERGQEGWKAQQHKRCSFQRIVHLGHGARTFYIQIAHLTSCRCTADLSLQFCGWWQEKNALCLSSLVSLLSCCTSLWSPLHRPSSQLVSALMSETLTGSFSISFFNSLSTWKLNIWGCFIRFSCNKAMSSSTISKGQEILLHETH